VKIQPQWVVTPGKQTTNKHLLYYIKNGQSLMKLRSSLSWECTKRRLIVIYRRFGTGVKQSLMKDCAPYILRGMMALENGAHTCNVHIAV
jgi:hypothetical protein